LFFFFFFVYLPISMLAAGVQTDVVMDQTFLL